MFEDFIRHARTDRYHLMCSIVAHDKKQPSYEDEERSIGDRPNPKKAKEKEDEIKKYIYEANRYRNDWKFQLHWKNLEWVSSRSQIKGINHIQFLQKGYINKGDRMYHWVGNPKLK